MRDAVRVATTKFRDNVMPEQKSKRGLLPHPQAKLDPWLEQRVTAAAWNEALSAISTGLAHDTNNCLTGILSMSDACLSQIDSEHPMHESLDLVKQSAHRASQLIQQLMRVHHEKTGERTYEDLNLITADTVELLKRVLRRQIDLNTQLETAPLPVWVDAVELKRVIILLALNAAQAMPTKGKIAFQTLVHHSPPAPSDFHGILPRAPVVCLMIAAEAATAAVVKVASLLDPFTHAESATMEMAWRLHLAKQFVEKHGGAISAESLRGQGVFTLWLPQSDLTEGGK